MYLVNEKEMKNVIHFSGQKRYSYFIKKIVDWEEVWGLYDNGWAVLGTENGQSVFPVWPAKAYAEICAIDEFLGYEAKSFSLDDFVDILIPKLNVDKHLIGVFPTPEDKAIIPLMKNLLLDIEEEALDYS